jgi:hypothetical protein
LFKKIFISIKMGSRQSIPPEDKYNIYLDDDEIITGVSPDTLNETLKELQYHLIISLVDYNCVTEYPATNRVHIIGFKKNSAVVHPELIHVLVIELG